MNFGRARACLELDRSIRALHHYMNALRLPDYNYYPDTYPSSPEFYPWRTNRDYTSAHNEAKHGIDVLTNVLSSY